MDELMGKGLGMCEVCGEPATQATRDMVEVEPTETDGGILVANWEYVGEWHHRCDEHRRTPVRTYKHSNPRMDNVPEITDAMKQVAEQAEHDRGYAEW